ncbi:MAG TPA: NAD(P)H-dependent oxidoreductase [Tepidisphaeraceae bacterium]|jgi:NAD(P)H-dependent FMN reductase
MNERAILVISGTNRPDSNALKIARIIVGHYQKAGVKTDLLSLSDLPREVFEPTAYANKPPGMVAIQQRVLVSQGIHVVTPEYNGSFPGVLKYFIDMLKFPESFERKPVAFTGEAAGTWGALRAVEQLQMIFGYRNAHLFCARVFIPGVVQKLDASGKLLDAELDQRLEKQAIGFAKYSGLLCEVENRT